MQSNNFERQWQDIGSELLKLTNLVGESGWYIQGNHLKNFETNLASYHQMEYACGVANGLNALEISLKVLGISPGDKVLTTPLSAFATTLAIINAGGTPIFCDTDLNGNIDLELAHQIIKDHKIKFFIPVHLYGNPLNLDKIKEISKDTLVIEDCAQAIGATFSQRFVGSAGHISAMSFYPTKNLGAMGDAGAILTNSNGHLLKSQSLRDYGQSSKYVHNDLGYNSRLDELHAAHLNFILIGKLQAWTQRRSEIAANYIRDLKNIETLKPLTKSAPVWHLFPVFTDNKSELIAHLKSKNIAAAEHYPGLINEQPCMKNVPFEVIGSLKNAKRIVDTQISLPIHPYLTNDEIHYVIHEVNSWRA